MLLDLHNAWLRGRVRKPADRSLRLFNCACCTHVERLVNDPRVRSVLRVVERHVDGLATDEELRASGDVVETAWEESVAEASRHTAAEPLWLAAPVPSLHLLEAAMYATGRVPGLRNTGGLYGLAVHLALKCRLAVQFATLVVPGTGQGTAAHAELRIHSALLHDCLGNPFRPSAPLPPAVLAWSDGTVRRLGEAIYDERAFDRLPVLADALLEAGCDDEALLAHLRSAGPHVRGCWALDLVLGRE